jgi:hypothetical protein
LSSLQQVWFLQQGPEDLDGLIVAAAKDDAKRLI